MTVLSQHTAKTTGTARSIYYLKACNVER